MGRGAVVAANRIFPVLFAFLLCNLSLCTILYWMTIGFVVHMMKCILVRCCASSVIVIPSVYGLLQFGVAFLTVSMDAASTACN